MFVSSMRSIYDWTTTSIFRYSLMATKENLDWAMKQNSQDIPQYTFQEDGNTLSILEYAVKCGEVEKVKQLLALAIKPVTLDGKKSILAFYLDLHPDLQPVIVEMVQNATENNEMLNLLVENHGRWLECSPFGQNHTASA